MTPVSPLQASISALITTIGNALVAFAVFDNTTAATIETAAVALVATAFVLANELRHHTIITSKTVLATTPATGTVPPPAEVAK